MGAQIHTSTTSTWELKYIRRVWRLPSRQTNMKKKKCQIHHARHTCSHVCQAWWIWIYSFEWMYPHMLLCPWGLCIHGSCSSLSLSVSVALFVSLSLSSSLRTFLIHMHHVCGSVAALFDSTTHCNTLQHTVTHCNTLREQGTANSSRIQVAKMSSLFFGQSVTCSTSPLDSLLIQIYCLSDSLLTRRTEDYMGLCVCVCVCVCLRIGAYVSVWVRGMCACVCACMLDMEDAQKFEA